MFENILGNQKVKKLLEQSVKSNKISHSYLMVGIEGIGKKIIATEFSKAILCLNNGNKPCNKCKSCIEFNGNNNPDFAVIEPEGNKIKIEQIRELQRRVQEKPIISNNKVYIINNADTMTNEAQNCLLKTLEEPPQYITIILIGSNENLFLTTIKSRCMIIRFNKIEDNYIKNYLKDKYNINNVSPNMLDIFQGSIKKAINLKDKQDLYNNLDSIFENINKEDIVDIMKRAQCLYDSKDDIKDMLDYINIVLLKKSRENYKFTNCIKIVENTKQRIEKNANYDMSIDNMIFNIWEEVN